MKESALRKLAAMAFDEAPQGEAACNYALGKLPKRYLKKYLLFLKNEIKKRKVTIWSAGMSGESERKAFAEVFTGKDVTYKIDTALGAGITVEHGDNVAQINVQNIIKRAIYGIKENL